MPPSSGNPVSFERQTDQPLYSRILWNRPVSRAAAGRLLLVGGHKSGVATLQACYQIAQASGIGALTILAPDVLRPLLGGIHDINFAPSTVSGSLAKGSLGQLQEATSHNDATLLGIDSSNNSETIILLENFIQSYQQPLIIGDSGLDVIGQAPDIIRSRPSTLIVLTMLQLFKLAGKLSLPLTIRPDSGISAKISLIEEFWQLLKTDLVLIGPEIVVKVGDHVSITTLEAMPKNLTEISLGVMSVCYAQNPTARYEGLTTGSYLIQRAIAAATGPTIQDYGLAITSVLSEHDD